MVKTAFLVWFKIAFAGLAIAAMGYEIVSLISKNEFSVVNYFSQFTTLTNLLASILFITSAVYLSKNKTSQKLEFLRGASTVYLLTTGIAFGLLLANLIDNVTLSTIPWSNVALHYIMPAAIMLDWFFNQPTKFITLRSASTWLVFPVAYLIYTVIRGFATGYYPYPFLDPDVTSLPKIAVIVLGLLLLVYFLAWLITRFGPHRTKAK